MSEQGGARVSLQDGGPRHVRALRSSALKLSVGYIGLGLLALVLFAAPLWYAWRVTIEDSRMAILQADAQRLAQVFRREGPKALAGLLSERVGLQIANERLLLFADPQRRPLAGNIDRWPPEVPLEPGFNTLRLQVDGHDAEVALVHLELPGGYHLLVGRDTAFYVPLERRFWYALLGAAVILSTFGALGGILIRRTLMARIHLVRQTVSAIMLGDLTHRLPAEPVGDELNTLSQTINRMLNQIEQLVHGVRNVSNAVAHDLRTPLAELRVRLEELSLTRPGPEHTFAEIDAAVSDVDRVISIFNALLRLAEIDSGMRRSGFVPVDLGEIAAAAVDFYQPAGEIKGARLQLVRTDTAPVRGDPVLLAQAISNLIDNALKYTPAGGNILVSVGRRADQCIELAVADSGPGIAEADRSKVTERFYRGDASRGTPGVGLGLSLVEAVARLHGTMLELEDNHPGLRASMVLGQDTRPIERPATAVPKPGELQHEPVYL
ncbi:MAG TPA: ATP-binding protein [Steroidobacteraceae bacterium]